MLETTLIAVIVILCLYILKNLFFPEKYRPPIPNPPPKPEKRKLLTKEELVVFNGKDDPKIFIGVKDQVFDVTKGKAFYGPGCSYNCLTGKDSTVALGKMDLATDFGDLKYDSLDNEEKETVDDWERKFLTKYDLVGWMVYNEEDRKSKEEQEEKRYEGEIEKWKQKLIQHELHVEEIKKKYYNN